jgi:hypothetical protein
MAKGGKLILPAEVRVCATCSYWDGERREDPDTRVVVVGERCVGECILRGKDTPCTAPGGALEACAWEPIADDPPTRPDGDPTPN